jgi:TDG/mug DNA glycosylase family protein
MWRILQNTNLAPVDVISGCNDDFKLPGSMGIGFTDVGSGTPGTDSNQFKTTHFDEWRQPFYDRLRAHVNRASENVEKCRCGRCGAPVAVVFSGKKQFSELFEKPVGKGRKKDTTFFNHTGINNQKIGTNYTLGGDDSKIKPTTQLFKPAQIPFGRQSILPAGWPLPLDKTEVWVMTSTSGAAAMTKEARYAPWKALAEWLESVPWPLNRQARCSRDIDMNT